MRSNYVKLDQNLASNQQFSITASMSTLHNDILVIKEKLHLPSIFVKLGNLKRRNVYRVG